jgi:CoA:oxalate CoA-transferase
VLDRGDVVPIGDPDLGLFGTGVPIQFSAAKTDLDDPPPRLGEHNEKVYGDLLGYPPERLRSLVDGGVI